MAGGKRRYQTVRDERLSVGVTQPVNGGSQVLGVAEGSNPRQPESQSGTLPLSYSHHLKRSTRAEKSGTISKTVWRARQESNL